jgi:hypothetical protein
MTTASNHSAAESFNAAHDAIRAGDRDAASDYYQQAFDLLQEDSPENCAFKAFIAYQHGVSLLKQHQLEGKTPGQLLDNQRAIAESIQEKWNHTVRLHNTLSPDVVRNCEERFHLAAIMQNLMRDPLMEEDTFEQLFYYGLQCAKEGNKKEAAQVLGHVLGKFESEYPHKRDMIATAHLRLAALKSDLLDLSGAATHARWVMKNAPPSNEIARMAMEVILEEAGRLRR